MNLRLLFAVTVAATVSLTSCATKKPAGNADASDAKPKPTATPAAGASARPSPSPSASPSPAPTPQVRTVARVKLEGGETVEQSATPKPDPSASPSLSPAASPSATPKPTPVGEKKPTVAEKFGQSLGNAWSKILPKKKPKPEAGATTATDPAAAPPAASPTPPQKVREPIHLRMWHMIFPRREDPPVAAPPQWIGTIRLIDQAEGYALVDSTRPFALSPGQTLNAVGNDFESGVLRVSGDRNPPFFLADIVSGRPKVGDRVYSPQP